MFEISGSRWLQGRKDKSRLALIDVKRASLLLAASQSHTRRALTWELDSQLLAHPSAWLSQCTFEDANGSIELQRFIMTALILLRGVVSSRLRLEPDGERKRKKGLLLVGWLAGQPDWQCVQVCAKAA